MGHRFQESDVSCGVAAFQMALEAAGIEPPPAAPLAEELDTDLQGTRPPAFQAYLEKRGIPYKAWHGDVILRDLAVLLDDHAVMICYQSQELHVGHFALLTDVASDSVELDDPWFGPGKRLPKDDFVDRWESRPPGCAALPRWTLAIPQQ